ncbi:MAG: hypothetical protein K0U68_02985 [Gammaproteobacteria bacterium]|nr:hypothetical protein [Gammaproteobacteria bacterium]
MKRTHRQRELSIGQLFANDREATVNRDRIDSVMNQIKTEQSMQELASFALINIWLTLLQLGSVFFVMASHQKNSHRRESRK